MATGSPISGFRPLSQSSAGGPISGFRPLSQSSAGVADQLVSTMVGFGRTLRASGVAASPQRMHALLEALGHLDVTRRDDVYWAGRVTLCSTAEELARYDRAFSAYFAGHAVRRRQRPPAVELRRAVAEPAAADGAVGEGEELPAATASALEVLRHRDLAQLTSAEREEVHRLIAAIHRSGEVRRSRRYRPSSRGALDPRRTVRAILGKGGEPADLQWRVRTVRPRRLVLIVDVSGSMQPYADALLRFAHAAASRRATTEVFTMGTRLTRITRELRSRNTATALHEVSRALPDWSGGTRLGELLKAFLDRWGQRGLARGAVVVIASDGWERGDASLLGKQMARLHRLAHRIVWVNPHRGQPGYVAMTGGMLAALPHVDNFVDGHSLGALERLARVISGDLADA